MPSISSIPDYPEVLARVQAGNKALDLSCGLGDPDTLQGFVLSLAQGTDGNHLAVRSFIFEMVYGEIRHGDSWRKAVATCAKHPKALQNVSIKVDWRKWHFHTGSKDFMKEAARCENDVISNVLTLKKLPLKTATMTIGDQEAEIR